MATGKGVLRIAIEDFLGTFDPSNFFENILGKFGKLMLEGAFGRYLNLLEKVASASKIQALVDMVNTHSTPLNLWEKFVILIGVLFAIISSFGNAFASPYGKLITYESERIARSGRLPVSVLLGLLDKDIQTLNKYTGDLADQGFDMDRLRAMDVAQDSELDLGLTLSLYWRKEIDDLQFVNRVIALGINEKRAQDILKAAYLLPSITDLVHFADRFAWDDDIARRFRYDEEYPPEVEEWTSKIGLPKEWFKRYWRAHWQLPSPEQTFEMLHRLRKGRAEQTFTEDDLLAFLKTTPYPPYFHKLFTAISYNPISRVDIRRIYKLKIFDAEEVKQRYMDLGYSEKDASTLAEFTVKYEDAQGNDVRDKYKDLSFTILKSLYQKGKINKSDLTTRLQHAKYDDTEIQLIIEYFDLAAVDNTAVDYKAQYVAEMVKYVSDAYQLEMITESDANTTLSALGLTEPNIKYILQKADYVSKLDILNYTLKKIHEAYTSGSITRDKMIGELGSLGISGAQQNKVIQEMELDLQYRTKRLTESEYRGAARAGIITIDEYRTNVLALGYTEYDVDILMRRYFPTGGA